MKIETRAYNRDARKFFERAIFLPRVKRKFRNYAKVKQQQFLIGSSAAVKVCVVEFRNLSTQTMKLVGVLKWTLQIKKKYFFLFLLALKVIFIREAIFVYHMKYSHIPLNLRLSKGEHFTKSLISLIHKRDIELIIGECRSNAH